jgi:hypothetical protein
MSKEDILFNRNDTQEKFIKKFMNNDLIKNNITNGILNTDLMNLDLIDEDVLNEGHINGFFLIIDVPPILMKVNLKNLISTAIQNRRSDIIRMLLSCKKIPNLYSIEPKIMMMCAQMELFVLLKELIKNKIPIHDDNYKCICYLSSLGKIEVLKLIMENYIFRDVTEITVKIIVEAIINNHLDIVEFFCPISSFDSAPDIMFGFLINGIQYGGHVNIIKYFVNGGIPIQQDDYHAVTIAKKFNRGAILRFFVEIDNNVLNLLDMNEKMQYDLVTYQTINKFLSENEAICGIMKDPILYTEKYFKCEKNLHVYKYEIWKEWIKKDNRWKCPLCFSNIEYTIYINKN